MGFFVCGGYAATARRSPCRRRRSRQPLHSSVAKAPTEESGAGVGFRWGIGPTHLWRQSLREVVRRGASLRACHGGPTHRQPKRSCERGATAAAGDRLSVVDKMWLGGFPQGRILNSYISGRASRLSASPAGAADFAPRRAEPQAAGEAAPH